MRERVWFFFILESFTAAFCLLFGFERQGLTALFVFALICACLLTAKLLAELLKAPVWLGAACAVVSAATMFLYAPDAFVLVAGVLLIDTLSGWVEPRPAIALSSVVLLLLALVFPPVPLVLLGALAGSVLAFAGVFLTRALVREREGLAARDERVLSLETSLRNQRSVIGGIERQGRRAERSRLAARIHDGVGHGIIGSVFMLEAAQLQLDEDPRAARKSIETATENLRGSLEEIRRELREERPVGEPVSLERIAARLDGFAADHPGITTTLETDGALDAVPQLVWACVHECLPETLMNMLRHSDANRFRVRVVCRGRLVTAEFSDNGSGAPAGDATPLERGIGLATIEERALSSGGRAFFSLTPHGFTARLVFTLRG
jgi:signal transduction histidine kinase